MFYTPDIEKLKRSLELARTKVHILTKNTSYDTMWDYSTDPYRDQIHGLSIEYCPYEDDIKTMLVDMDVEDEVYGIEITTNKITFYEDLFSTEKYISIPYTEFLDEEMHFQQSTVLDLPEHELIIACHEYQQDILKHMEMIEK